MIKLPDKDAKQENRHTAGLHPGRFISELSI